MFSRNSPLKRKHNEFRDPDYPQKKDPTEEDDNMPGCSKHFLHKRRKSDDGAKLENSSQNEIYLHKVKQVIEREFQREIVMKQQQLEEIDDRLEKAKQLLDRLRYGIVFAYYKKQEIPLTGADAATLRGPNSLFEREDKGPQMPLHPSVKKLMGKRPKDLSEVMRSCPKRTAAQNAVQTIRSKSQAQKREERKLKKIIRDQGIVIDHSKQNRTDSDVNALLNAAAEQNSTKSIHGSNTTSVSKEISKKPSGKSLNAARLNNKIKHLIVVGNTSKYIGNEMERDMKSNTQNLTHKWLVYVQSKETSWPIEKFIKKVRFHLHRSYRPNDVVDIESPPFQVSRRGWGEFPIRVQLFFHSELHQKPVQLIHNIVLDQTFSGIQTLGSETLLEIWLRDIKLTIPSKSEEKIAKTEDEEIMKKVSPTKPKTSIMASNDDIVDENLLDFLNKIEASPFSISADIEKIQPTVLVNEPLAVKIKTPSPEKCKIFTSTYQKYPIKMAPLVDTITSKTSENILTISSNSPNNSTVSAAQTSTSVAVSSESKTPVSTSSFITTKPTMTFTRLPTSSVQVQYTNNITTISNISQIPPLRPITPLLANANPSLSKVNPYLSTTTQKPPIILNREGKILMPAASVASAVRRTILPIVSSIPTTISNPISQTSQVSLANKPKVVSIPTSSAAGSVVLNPPKQILQKKLVQLVDSTGKVKYIQMLVAASSPSSSVQSLNNSSVAPKIITIAPSFVKNNTVTNATQFTKTIATPLLKSPNGAHLVPALTSKANIFKIVPESRQSKPQVLTFSTTTIATGHTNTLTNVKSQQQLKHPIVTTAQTATQITTMPALGSSAVKPNNIQLPAANRLQKSNCNNAVTATKNLVFQKEGKVYIIDAEQIKYKQQQKKQVSLLKPQISLLKQQQQQKLATGLSTISNSNIDTSKTDTASQSTNNNNNKAHQLHFGLKQQRINSINILQLMQMKRVLFEKQFLRQEFTNIRSAVEFLLRRLKLIVSKDSLVAVFPFASHSLQEFQSLTAFKQRACEWLRAKNISRLMRSHKDLQSLNSTSKELFWSTKEIATFARQYAYTPPIKSLPKPDEQQKSDNSNEDFMDLVKSELKQEQSVLYDTLTDHCKVRKWVDKVWHTLTEYEHQVDQSQIIDIDGIEEVDDKKHQAFAKPPDFQLPNSTLNAYLSPPEHLENQCQLVSDICKDLHIRLVHEELDSQVYHPSTQTVLAQCLHLFIEKLLRQTIALKQGNSSLSPIVIDSMCTLTPQDFAKVLTSNSEFDFLTNNNFGSASLAECLDESLKQEDS